MVTVTMVKKTIRRPHGVAIMPFFFILFPELVKRFMTHTTYLHIRTNQ